MPSFTFDLTEQAIDYTLKNIKDMPGNNGQQQLIDNLEIDAYCITKVDISSNFDVDIQTEYDIKFNSSHPEAIDIILNIAEESFVDFSERIDSFTDVVDMAFQEFLG
jgi:hypothetical protein